MIYNLKDYSYLEDNSLAVSIIMSKISDGDTVKLGGGTVELDGRYATPKTIYLPRYSNDKKYYAFCVDNKKNITIDGEGAYLLFDGNVSPFGFENCENVTLKNFVIDYKTPCMIQGKIVEADENFIVVDFSACNLDVKYDMEHKMLLFRESCDSEYLEADSFLLNEFDPELKKHSKTSPDYFLCVNKPHPVYGFMSACVDTEVLENGHFRFTYKDKKFNHTVGNCIVGTVHERRNNNVHLLKCKNVTMENITMYSSLSFGIISLLGENITFNNVNSVLKPGSKRLIAVVADMFHCVNTKGTIMLSDSRVENLMDDCLNIHSLLSVVKKTLDNKTALIHFTYLAKKALNLYSKSEKINVLNPDSFECERTLTVVSSEYMGDYHLKVEFEEDVSDLPEGYILESEDAKPEVYVSNCSVGNNRGRGFLVHCGEKTVVENCTLYNTGVGIDVNGACKSYLEGSAVTDLTIKNNDFTMCGYVKNNYAIRINPVGLTDIKSCYHHNIKIKENTFNADSERMIYMRAAENVEIGGNFAQKDGEKSDLKSDNGFKFDDCENIKLL